LGHPALDAGRVAVITGAASGIGLAAARKLAARRMKVVLADLAGEDLTAATETVAEDIQGAGGDPGDLLAVASDMSDPASVAGLRDGVLDRYGAVDFLMNNAVTRIGGATSQPLEDWRHAFDVNFWGVFHGVQAFLAVMRGQDRPAMIVNAGSKQGITNPPGNAAYNATKAALKSYTESLQHELRGQPDNRVTAHLLIPGFTTTAKREHKPGAWWPSQVVDFMLEGLERGDFYILCPDNEVTTAMDHDRIRWAAGDITENRPPLSRWHPQWSEVFSQRHGAGS
jgi:NAD(P)-dependent dehydrogenase (short-subunit alcohol dehydrogenase family)